MKLKRYAAVLLLFVVVLPFGGMQASATDYTCCLTDVQGDWRIDYLTNEDIAKSYAMTNGESEAFWNFMHQIVGIFQQQSVLNPPKGIMMRGDAGALEPGDYYLQHGSSYPDRRIMGDIWLKFIELRQGANGKLLPYNGGDESHPQINVQTNYPGAVSAYSGFGYERLYDSLDREIFFLPEQTNTLGGYPVYDGRVLVIADKSKPLFVPVTREQYLKAYIWWTEYTDKQNGTEGENDFLLEGLRQELQEMTPEERQKPAYFNMDMNRMGDQFRYSFLVDPETDEDRALVMFNPEYYDASRPRSDVQLITLTFLRDYPMTEPEPVALGEGNHIDSVRFGELMYSMDYTALSALLSTNASAAPDGKSYSGASSWAVAELDKANSYGLITDAVRSNLSQKVTRGEFAALAVRLYEKTTGQPASAGNVSFTDTSDPEILKAANLGLVTGVGNGLFNPGAFLTREQMATILYRALKIIAPNTDFTAAQMTPFTDNGQVEFWARDGVYYCASVGIVGGVGNNMFNPDGTATREQAVLVCTRSYELYK